MFASIKEAVAAIVATLYPPKEPKAPNIKRITCRAQSGAIAVFLGGSTCGSRGSWRQEVARPLLEDCGVSYFDPAVSLSHL